jgi:hypothetical protein
MTWLRRACPVFALIVAMAHVGALSAAVMANAPGALAGPECCAAGAHPGAMCPLHGKRHVPASSSDASTCRLSCAVSAHTAMLLPALPLPAAMVTAPVILARAKFYVFVPAGSDSDLQTLSPPPRS